MRSGPAVEGASTGRRDGLAAIPRAVWALGFVSLFMDVSSEMIHALLPVFLASSLGASTTIVGVIEGIAGATASITKIFSGALSDWLGKRKLLALLGYGIAAATKPLFPLAASPGWVLLARFVDRTGKGLRGAPRDALVGDLAPPHLRGASYGLRQSLDTVGAFAGPLAATVLMAASGDDYRLVFWLAVPPALVSVAILLFWVEEPQAARAPSPRIASPIRAAAVKRLGSAYWWLVAIASTFTLARFSEAFLILRATGLGLAVVFAPMVLVTMNLVYALAAYPAGVLSDRVDRWSMLGAGFATLIAADLVLAAATGIGPALVGIALWGLHMGLTQGVFAALVADVAPAELRGTAFGFFNLAGGGATLLASVLAGLLWSLWGAPATFLAGAGLTAAAGVATLLLRRTRAP